MKWIASRNRAQERRLATSRIHLHFTPISSSWMNLVERLFRDLTVDCIRDGSFASTRELNTSIENYLKDRDLSPKRYVWKVEGQAILEKSSEPERPFKREILYSYLQIRH